MPLDLEVQVSPAGGLAVVEMIPEDPAFLGGVHVYLDYENMEETELVPEVSLSCPPLASPHEIDPEDSPLYHSHLRSAIDAFLGGRFGTRNYERLLENLKDRLAGAQLRFEPTTHRRVQIRPVDINGQASTGAGRALVAQLSERLESDFLAVMQQRRPNYAVRNRLVTTGAWLFGAVPPSIHAFVVQEVVDHPRRLSQQIIYAAGRIFRERDEIHAFFQAMEKNAWPREHQERWFIIPWLYSAKRLLSGRENAPSALDHDQTIQFYRFLFDDLASWIEGERVNGFAATVNLFFYLLRFREVNGRFLAPTSETDRDVREELIQTIDAASARIRGRRSFLHGNRRQAALEVLAGLKEFLDLRGSLDIIERLSDLDDED